MSEVELGKLVRDVIAHHPYFITSAVSPPFNSGNQTNVRKSANAVLLQEPKHVSLLCFDFSSPLGELSALAL